MKWFDAYGNRIMSGDIVEDLSTRRIGRVVYRYNKPWMDVWKEFSAAHLSYDPVERFSTDEAYMRQLAPKKEWRYKLHGGKLNHVEVLQKAPLAYEPQRTVPIDMPPWEAPAPIDWRMP